VSFPTISTSYEPVTAACDHIHFHETDPLGILIVEHRREIAHESHFAVHPLPCLPPHGVHHKVRDFERRITHRLGHEKRLDRDRPAAFLLAIAVRNVSGRRRWCKLGEWLALGRSTPRHPLKPSRSTTREAIK
jgi:hypothetical protein